MNNIQMVDNPGKKMRMDLQMFAEGSPASPAPAAPAVSAPEPVSSPTPSPAPAAPEPAPAPAAPPANPEPTASPAPAPTPGVRNVDMLNALLDGADPEILFGAKPPTATPAPAPATLPVPGGQNAEPSKTPSAAPEPTAPPITPADPGPESLILGKFKSVDDIAKSYQELEGKLRIQGNELGDARRQLRELTAQPPKEPTQPSGQPTAPSQPEVLTPEMKEKMLEQYYEDPITFTEKILEGKLEKILESKLQPLTPVVEKYQQDRQVEDFARQIEEFMADGQHTDFFELKPYMQQIVEKHGDAITKLPNSVEILYNMAKGMVPAPEPPAPPPTVEQLLNDPNYRTKILSDPSIKAEITKGYVQDVKGGAPPVVIGTQPGGAPPAAPAEKPKSVREASSIFSRFLKQQ